MINLVNHKINVLILFLLNVFVIGYSQERIKINVENKSCIQCDCSFLKKDSIIYISRTDTEGFLMVPEYVLANYTGFEIKLSNWTRYYLKSENVNLSQGINCNICDIEDSIEAIDLEEVVVYAKKNIVEDDGYKLVYNADKDFNSTSVTTTDVLRKTPMVSVDINGSPSIKGSSNVKILVNNREVSGLLPAQIIEQIAPEDINKIEVITSPGARYDAEGTSGVINIITRKKIYFKSSGYTNLGIGTKGSHIFANYSYNLNDKWSILNSFNSLVSYSKTESKQSYRELEKEIFQRELDGKNNGNLYGYQLTVSKTSEKDNLNIYLNYHLQKLSLDEKFKTFENQMNESYTQNGYSFYKMATDYSRKLSDAIKIDISTAGFYLPINNKMNLNDFENKYNYSITNNTNYFDTEILFSKRLSLILGGKSLFNFFKDDNSQINISARQMNFATYLEGTYKITNKLLLNFGTRYENYILKGWTDIDKNYKDLFFDGNINYKFDNKTTLSFLFNNRTQRPSYSNILPIESYTSSNVISVGNPDLNPEMSYNYEVGFSKYIGEQFFKISPFYKHTKNKISNFLIFTKNTFYTNYINIDSENDLGISVWTSLNFFKKRLNMNYGFDVVRKIMINNYLKVNGIQFLNNLNMTYKISDDLSLNFFGTFNTPNIYLQGKENSYTYNNLSLQNNFCKGKVRVAVSMDNPFSKGITLKREYLIDNYTYKNQLTYYNRGVRLIFIYKFGKKQPDSTMKMQDNILKEQNN